MSSRSQIVDTIFVLAMGATVASFFMDDTIGGCSSIGVMVLCYVYHQVSR
jgi:hypothetical protein